MTELAGGGDGSTYSLSATGQTLIPVLEDLCDWGSKLFGIIPNLARNPREA
jgi:DNA-binding HxlR family transcriptional regulator